MLRVEDYERIRRRVVVEGRSSRAVAKELGHSRKTVAKALKYSTPPGYRRTKPVRRPVIDPVGHIIDAWLEEDKKSPRKQRHTAQRIWERLVDEYGFTGSASAVRRYVARVKATGGELFYPLVFDPAEESQMDWGEAYFFLNGQLRKGEFFCARMCYSTASFVQVYENEKQECLLDGHVRTFGFLEGIPRRCAYDNPKTIVITVGRGRKRKLTERFMEIKSHYLFETRFCNKGKGNEKGHVENLVKHMQRKFMTPLPDVSSLEELNDYLRKACERDLDGIVESTGKTRRELLEEERARMLPLPKVPFEACRRVSTFASKQLLVRFDKRYYSVPAEYGYHSVTVKGFVDIVKVFAGDEQISAHKRLYGPERYALDPLHYIPLLERKPGGIYNARPFKGEPWGEDLALMRRELEYRYGSDGTKKFVNILLLFTEFPEGDVKQAVRTCVKRRAFSDEAVRGILTYEPRQRQASLDLSGQPELSLAGDGIRPASLYDSLIPGEVRK